MSRSYKKTPIIKYAPSSKRGGTKKVKRCANKSVRRGEYGNGMQYKRAYEQWDIHDIVDRSTWKDAQNWSWFPTFKDWAKEFLWK